MSEQKASKITWKSMHGSSYALKTLHELQAIPLSRQPQSSLSSIQRQLSSAIEIVM